ncbi:MAG: DUF374 domain-containing protein [Alphaproteobacteria bacterium]|nr:DUF374 domain-containing protein [Alphaproteobacteria bacterium]
MARLIAFLVRLLSCTYRFEIIGIENIKAFTDKNKPVLITLWHGRSMVLPYFWSKNFKKKSGAAVFSDHKDGRLMRSICAHFGVKPIIGSSKKKGAMAARGIIEALKSGTSVAMTPDGPTGPRMRLTTDSLLFFAGRLNVPLISFTPSSSNAKILGSWDRYMIHRPFAKVRIKIGEPVWIKKEQAEDHETKVRIEANLITELQNLDQENGLPKIEPQPRDLKKKSRI